MALKLAAGLTLYFARHGQTVANVQGRFQGWTKDTSLTEHGIADAHALAAILRREVKDMAHLSFVASPLPRARTTMEIVLGDLGLPRDRYGTDARISEINLGAWDGLTHAEARARDPKAYEERENHKWTVRVPGGGENYADVAARAENWFNDLKVDTFAVSHGAFTRVLRGLLMGLDWKGMSDLDEPQGCVFRLRDSVLKRLDA